MYILFVVGLALFAACDRVKEIAGSDPAVVVNGKQLTAQMSDDTILEVFGIEKVKATSTVARGPDGYSTQYTHGEQKVGITRSVVTGVAISADGPIKGDWRLGMP